MKRLHNNKMDAWLKYMSPWIKRVGGRENKSNLERMKRTPLRRLELILRMLKMIGSTWREIRRLKGLTKTILMIKKDWYSHRSMRTPFREGMESTFDFEATRIPQIKQNKGFGLQNKPEQTYDRDFVRSFRGGAHTGSIVQHHHVQGSAHDIRSVPESAYPRTL